MIFMVCLFYQAGWLHDRSILVYNFLKMNIRCPECGNENRSEARFCRFCGKPLSQDATLVPSADHREEQATRLDMAPLPTAEHLPDGFLIQARYRIRRKLEPTEADFRYEADDLLACRNCQAVQTNTDTDFCEACGAELAEKSLVIVLARLQTEEDLEGGQDGEAFTEQGIIFQIERQPASPEPPRPEVYRHLFCGFQSHSGKIRDSNEDSLLVLQLAGMCDEHCALQLGIFAIADGVGGAASGEVASQAAVRCLASGAVQRIFGPELAGTPAPVEDLPQILKELVLAANQSILDLRNQKDDAEMGCTLTGVLVRGQQALIFNVGDSRVYRLHQGKLNLLTEDHSMVARLLREGLIQPEEIYTHAQRNIIYRSLGSRSDLNVDIFTSEVEAEDRLLLCSDGLWEMVRDNMLEEVLLQSYDPQQACDRLVELANLAGGEDNISVIVLRIQEN
jgi:serine/threonine protein phosphatase PrpC